MLRKMFKNIKNKINFIDQKKNNYVKLYEIIIVILLLFLQ